MAWTMAMIRIDGSMGYSRISDHAGLFLHAGRVALIDRGTLELRLQLIINQ